MNLRRSRGAEGRGELFWVSCLHLYPLAPRCFRQPHFFRNIHSVCGIKRVIELMLTRTERAMAKKRLAFVEAFVQELDAKMEMEF